MNLTKLKSASEMKLPGVDVEFVQENGILTEVILKAPGSEGYSIRVTGYSMSAWSRSSYEEKDGWRVTTDLGHEEFDREDMADNYIMVIQAKWPDKEAKKEKIKIKVREGSSQAEG